MMMPAFIMIGSTIMPAIWPACSSSSRGNAGRSLKPTTSVRSVIAVGIPVLAGTWCGRAGSPTSSASGVTDTCTESWWP